MCFCKSVPRAVVRKCSLKGVLTISQNSQENTCVGGCHQPGKSGKVRELRIYLKSQGICHGNWKLVLLKHAIGYLFLVNYSFVLRALVFQENF